MWTIPLVLGVWSTSTFALYFAHGEVASLLNLARDLVRLSMTSTVALLGFFLSGFAIFATLGDKKLLTEMAKTPHTKYSVSYFKYNFYVLLRPLISLVALAFLLLPLLLLLGPGTGIGSVLIAAHWYRELRFFVCAAVGLDAASFAFLIMSAATFVANVYISVATSIRWELLREGAKKNLLSSYRPNESYKRASRSRRG
jgi:hypothetical protein